MDPKRVVRRALEREPDRGERLLHALQVAGIVLVAVATAVAVGVLIVRDQIARHRRQLFSPHPLRRLAALGYLARAEASVDAIRLLRDYIAWEPRPLIRRRAAQILARMERQLAQMPISSGEVAG